MQSNVYDLDPLLDAPLLDAFATSAAPALRDMLDQAGAFDDLNLD